jgi:hypothetical protein
MFFSVKKVEPDKDYILVLTFENGEKKRFDMKPYLDIGIFRDLRDEKLFRTVHVSFNTVAWDNDADFDPEALYEGGLPISE